MIDSPNRQIVAEPTDLLASNSSVWVRGLSLAPVEPRLREQIVSGYLEMLEAATYIGNTAECEYLKARIVEFGGQP